MPASRLQRELLLLLPLTAPTPRHGMALVRSLAPSPSPTHLVTSQTPCALPLHASATPQRGANKLLSLVWSVHFIHFFFKGTQKTEISKGIDAQAPSSNQVTSKRESGMIQGPKGRHDRALATPRRGLSPLTTPRCGQGGPNHARAKL
ncbi:hypothetical protein PIB30_029257 [Stylosanthes scabra]|uniref:Secreted protein n=1 Tax=Stylosanthes scabra TaxID=79078 RepID=A0ABU6TDC9_9FABA|nr:hypothetical protein [Stylosanthes scabra]